MKAEVLGDLDTRWTPSEGRNTVHASWLRLQSALDSVVCPRNSFVSTDPRNRATLICNGVRTRLPATRIGMSGVKYAWGQSVRGRRCATEITTTQGKSSRACFDSSSARIATGQASTNSQESLTTQKSS